MVGITEKFKALFRVSLNAKGLTAGLCICALGLASIPWVLDETAFIAVILLFLLAMKIANLILVTINERKDQKKDEREEKLIDTILEKCENPKDVQDLLGEDALRELGKDIVRKRQTQDYWTTEE